MSFAATRRIVGNILSERVSVLDYGCGSGHFLQAVSKDIAEGIGVDFDGNLIERANENNRSPNIRYVQADAKAEGLPFEPEHFDLIVALGVLEHVGPEAPYIEEFHRLLRKDGHLVIEVPSNGPFRAFDIGNIKYNFPKLHRWFYCYVARQPEYYEKTFGDDAPMFGQFSREAKEHKHYRVQQLKAIAEPYFELQRYGHYGFFFELIQFLQVLVCKPFGKSWSPLFSFLLTQDCKILSPLGRANIVGVFRKK
jgi:SAM-dependent methyltransferase